MAFRFIEQYKSGDGAIGAGGEEEFYYTLLSNNPIADDADSPAAVLAYVSSQIDSWGAPGVVTFALYSPSGSGNVLAKITRERIAPYMWKIGFIFRSPTFQKLTGDAAFSFTTGGQSQHINYSLGTQVFNPSNGTAVNNGNAIGVSRKGTSGVTVNGIDRPTNGFEFKTTFYIPQAQLNSAYLALLVANSYCYNTDTVNITIRGKTLIFAPGSLLFKAAEGQERADQGDWEFSLNWACSQNFTGLVITGPPPPPVLSPTGGGPVGPPEPPVTVNVGNVNGWDYLEVDWDTGVDGNSNALNAQLLGARVHKIYNSVPLQPIVPAAFTAPLQWV